MFVQTDFHHSDDSQHMYMYWIMSQTQTKYKLYSRHTGQVRKIILLQLQDNYRRIKAASIVIFYDILIVNVDNYN